MTKYAVLHAQIADNMCIGAGARRIAFGQIVAAHNQSSAHVYFAINRALDLEFCFSVGLTHDLGLHNQGLSWRYEIGVFDVTRLAEDDHAVLKVLRGPN